MRNAAPDWRYALQRAGQIARPNVSVTPPPEGVRFLRDVDVAVRDATVLRANVFLPANGGPFPAIVCAHPYGKDAALPKRSPFGYEPSIQYRMLRQTEHVTFSAWTTWESPDPAFWCAAGYAVVNADLRGFGRSGGTSALLTAQEARDYYDLIEWAAAQSWSTGRVGLNGVSYLALSQWNVAATRPPHLAAICPWEGFSDCYRDFARPGGVREDGFVAFWSAMLERGGRMTEDFRQEQLARPLFDDWWSAHTPELERIDAPALICGSFSDQALHSRGCFEAFRRIGSQHRWLYTHRAGKWTTYYSAPALAAQRRFFDFFLKGEQNGMLEEPRVRLEIRSDRDTVHATRGEHDWPPAGVAWRTLHLHAGGRLDEAPAAEATVRFASPSGFAPFVWTISEDVTIAGPMVLQLGVSLEGCDDASLFAIVRKVSSDSNVPFEGSYGFGYDVVAKGSLRLSLRRLDDERSLPWHPVYPFDRFEKLSPGEIVTARIEILPSATFFSAGDELHVEVRARWLYDRKIVPIYGLEFYEASGPGTVALHCGGATQAHLLVPVLG
jgi:predicted acyl esterase